MVTADARRCCPAEFHDAGHARLGMFTNCFFPESVAEGPRLVPSGGESEGGAPAVRLAHSAPSLHQACIRGDLGSPGSSRMARGMQLAR